MGGLRLYIEQALSVAAARRTEAAAQASALQALAEQQRRRRRAPQDADELGRAAGSSAGASGGPREEQQGPVHVTGEIHLQPHNLLQSLLSLHSHGTAYLLGLRWQSCRAGCRPCW